MSKLLSSAALSGFLLSFSTLLWADNCENARNTYDDVYCINKVFANADKELNKNYQELRAKLNAQQKNTLKRGQLAWIRQRDAQCSDEHEGKVYVRCNLDETVQRSAWLRERMRECHTIGCQTRRLSE